MSSRRLPRPLGTALWLLLAPWLLLALVPSSAAAVPPTQGRSAEIAVRWRGKTYAESKLPEELGPGARAAVRAWAETGLREGWRLDLDGDARVLLITPARANKAGRYLRLIEQVGAEVDGALPPPPPQPEPQPVDPAPTAPDVIPEDPEEAPVPGLEGPTADAPDGPTTWTWGTAERTFDQDTAVLFVLRDEGGVAPVLDRLREQHAYLEPWIPAALQLAGWSLEQPLAGLCYELPSGVEEWSVENEIVHRTAELLVLRRFGPLPTWLLQGFAWTVEMRLQKSIYCFPGRTGFVFATEHTSWPTDLRGRFGGREDRPLRMAELSALRRGAYDERAAPLSWGFAEYLRREHAPCLPLLADALRAARDRDNRIDHGDGTWSRDRDYEVPDEVQFELLERCCGPTLLADAPRFLARIR